MSEWDTHTLRGPLARALAVGLWAISTVIAVSILLSVQYPAAFAWLGVPAFLAVIGWSLYWRPHVMVSPAGITLTNVYSERTIPWPAVESFDLRFGLGINTRWGKTFTAWSLPAARRSAQSTAEGRRKSLRPSVPASIQTVLDYHTALKDAGFLDDPRYPDAPPQARLSWPVIAATVVTAGWAILGLAS